MAVVVSALRWFVLSAPSEGMRLSAKQRDLLETVASLPEYMKGHPASLYFGNVPEHIWFTFKSENAVRSWLGNLVARGLLRLENDFFYHITPEGREAVKSALDNPTR